MDAQRIIIDDKHQRNLRYLMTYNLIAVVIVAILFYTLSEQDLPAGILIALGIFGLLNLVGFLILLLKRSGQQEIGLNEIAAVTHKKNGEKEGVNIELKNGKTRKVFDLGNEVTEVLRYFKEKNIAIK